MVTFGVGSHNPAKIRAVERLSEFFNLTVQAVDVPSGVSDQPRSDDETKRGAVQRAKGVIEKSNADFGVGLEGGIMEINNTVYVCNWGALVDRNGQVFTASGARIPLPESIAEGLRTGIELGDVIDKYTNQLDVSKGEGTIGILTDGLITRTDMFFHIMQLLYGQYQFYSKSKG
ncbi:DUF84 family protein [Scopulibacillus cellulosilyticus]|uniref:Probable inosine/xanthosine triphosphatase n=1 Tax=Scopulibacillus cellulosilyticus TaxID=2665665 RepID=A0ABW2Q1S9_9BACL